MELLGLIYKRENNMQALMSWVMSHLGLIASVLGALVVVDTALASSDVFKSNSSAQAILASVKKVADFVMSLLPKAS